MDRQELHSLLTAALRSEPDATARFSRAAPSERVKSRLIEAHPVEGSPEGVRALLDPVAGASGATVRSLAEDLWLLDSGEESFFLDTLNKRFWLLHTTANADRLQRLVGRYFLTNPRLDTAWMPSAQLDGIEGERQFIKSSFVADDLRPAERGPTAARRWRVQVEGVEPQELLDLVRRELPRYAVATALTAVGSLVHEKGLGRVFVVADYRGRFVSTGDSFDLVAGVLWRTLDRYERFVRQIEDNYRVTFPATENGALAIEGDVATLTLPRPINDMAGFVFGLFNCREPFRLWAVPRQIAAHEWVADAVDLHVGQPLRIEISPDRVRVLLTEHTCGNTLARLVANLQHRYDAQVELPLSA